MGKETQTPVEGLLFLLRPQREFCSGLACSCTLGGGSRCLEIPSLLCASSLSQKMALSLVNFTPESRLGVPVDPVSVSRFKGWKLLSLYFD